MTRRNCCADIAQCACCKGVFWEIANYIVIELEDAGGLTGTWCLEYACTPTGSTCYCAIVDLMLCDTETPGDTYGAWIFVNIDAREGACNIRVDFSYILDGSYVGSLLFERDVVADVDSLCGNVYSGDVPLTYNSIPDTSSATCTVSFESECPAGSNPCPSVWDDPPIGTDCPGCTASTTPRWMRVGLMDFDGDCSILNGIYLAEQGGGSGCVFYYSGDVAGYDDPLSIIVTLYENIDGDLTAKIEISQPDLGDWEYEVVSGDWESVDCWSLAGNATQVSRSTSCAAGTEIVTLNYNSP